MILAEGQAALFGAGALAEVADCGEIGGRRFLGSIDRLVVTHDRVLAVDFKSNRLVPDRAEEVPEGILRQMGAYAALLAQVYPGPAGRGRDPVDGSAPA